jgi:hypothetical protein
MVKKRDLFPPLKTRNLPPPLHDIPIPRTRKLHMIVLLPTSRTIRVIRLDSKTIEMTDRKPRFKIGIVTRCEWSERFRGIRMTLWKTAIRHVPRSGRDSVAKRLLVWRKFISELRGVGR